MIDYHAKDPMLRAILFVNISLTTSTRDKFARPKYRKNLRGTLV